MDQDAFRDTYRTVNERACVMERAILTNQCGCSQAERFCIAEREGVTCLSSEGHERCAEFVSILREQARFALKAATGEQPNALPYGKAMRVQVGGLRGLQAVLNPDDDQLQEKVMDADALIRVAIRVYGSLMALPFKDIMPHIAAYRGKTRRRRSREKS